MIAAAGATLQQTQALLALVEADRAAKCAALQNAARTLATELTAQAHATARQRMRRAIDDERALRAERVGAAAAELQTRRRLAEQARDTALLTNGWEALPAALAARWRDAAARAAWVQRAIAEATAALPRAAWRIVHAPGWPAQEIAAVAGEIAAVTGAAPSFGADAAIAGGLSIAVAGTAIDATVHGLLADRAEIGARLLHALREQAS